MNDCPACGCNDVEEQERQVSSGGVRLRLYCRHCFHCWNEQAPQEPAKSAKWLKLLCRQCGGEMKVQSTRKKSGVRYMKCEQCKRSIQLTEETAAV